MKKLLLIALTGVMGLMTSNSFATPLQRKVHSRTAFDTVKVMPENTREKAGLKFGTDRRGHSTPGSTVFSASQGKPFSVGTRAGGNMGDSFYGYLIYSNDDYYLGLYEITPWDGYELYFEDPGYESGLTGGFDLAPDNGWYTDNKLNGVSLIWVNQNLIGGYYSYSIDFETGEMLDYYEYPNWYDMDYYFNVCTLNPDEGLVYGNVFETLETGWKYYWASAPQQDLTDINLIREIDLGDSFLSICYNPDEKSFYGFTRNYDFVKIDTRGNLQRIASAPTFEDADVDFYPLTSGMIWNRELDVYFWNAQIANYSTEEIFSSLYFITPDGEFEEVEKYSLDQQFSFFVSTNLTQPDNAPETPKILSVEFEGPSLTGTMTARMPYYYVDQSSITTEMTYTALLNGEIYIQGTATAGQRVPVEYTVSEAGEYTFAVYATIEDVNSFLASTVKYVGIDTPSAPENIWLTPQSISWDPVVIGAHKGYVDTENLSYDVYLNGELLATVHDTTYPVDLYTKEGLEKYTASVVATGDGLTGAEGYSNTIVAGTPLDLPLVYKPTQAQFDDMTVLNANKDKYEYEGFYDSMEITWELSPYGIFSGATEYLNTPMNDYLFTAPVNLQKGEAYSLIFQAGKYMDWYDDIYIDIMFASSPTPQGVEGYIAEQYSPDVYLRDTQFEVWEDANFEFEVPEDGIYYIGFHCVSKPGELGYYMRNIFVGPQAGTPEAVTGLSVKATSPGQLKAMVDFTLPTLTLAGETLTGNLTAVVKVNDSETDFTVTGEPGSTQQVEVPTEQGVNDLTVYVVNGEYSGVPAYSTVFTGVAVPATPQNVTLTLDANNLGGELIWSKVTTSNEEGGYIDPETVTYTVLVYTSINPEWMVVARNITDNHYHVWLDPEAPQAQYAWGVMAYNEAGSNEEENFATAIMGKAYPVPFEETFGTGTPVMNPWLNWPVDGMNTTQIYSGLINMVVPNYPDETTYAIIATNNYGIACNGLLSMPYFSTRGYDELQMTINYLGGPDTAGATVYANIYGSKEDIVIGTIPANNGDSNELQEIVFNLPASLLNQDWVQVYYKISFATATDKFAMSSVGVSGSMGVATLLGSDKAIVSGNQTIIVKGYAGKQVVISRLDGRIVYKGTANDDVINYTVAPGIYVVRAGESQAKLVVR